MLGNLCLQTNHTGKSPTLLWKCHPVTKVSSSDAPELHLVNTCKADSSSSLVSSKAILFTCSCYVANTNVQGANMGPTWVLSSSGGPHVGPMNLALWYNILCVTMWAIQNRSHTLIRWPVNLLPNSNAIWRHSYWSTLAQVMACCLTAQSHFLNQCCRQ